MIGSCCIGPDGCRWLAEGKLDRQSLTLMALGNIIRGFSGWPVNLPFLYNPYSDGNKVGDRGCGYLAGAEWPKLD